MRRRKGLRKHISSAIRGAIKETEHAHGNIHQYKHSFIKRAVPQIVRTVEDFIEHKGWEDSIDD